MAISGDHGDSIEFEDGIGRPFQNMGVFHSSFEALEDLS